MSYVDVFKADAAEAGRWIEDLALRLGWHDREKTYRVFVAALHGLRDSLPADEAAHLGICLPTLLRGLYFDGWLPASRFLPLESSNALFERIQDSVHRDPAVEPEPVAKAVFALIGNKLRATDLEEAKVLTPAALRGLWPD